MRKVNPNDFQVATRTTSREVNRSIVLNLVREHDGISRAELAQLMGVQKSAITLLINELVIDELIYEGSNGGSSSRGPKPIQLHLKTQDRPVIGIDIRFTGTYVMLSDFSGKCLDLQRFDTIFEPQELVKELAGRIRKMLRAHSATGNCVGIGVAAPGMVDHHTGRILHAPMMGWRNVNVRDDLAELTGLPVTIESAPKACALSQMWLSDSKESLNNFVYLGVSDGVGVGAVVGGELLRGASNIATEFGHTPLNIDGPRCLCGLSGCWEAYTSNLATLSRYLGRSLSRTSLLPNSATEEQTPTMTELIRRAHSGETRAVVAIETTGRYIGLGLATIIAILNPSRIYIGGEITEAWDLIGDTVRTAMAERTLTAEASQTPIEITTAKYPRLSGAVALVTAPVFAAPRLA